MKTLELSKKRIIPNAIIFKAINQPYYILLEKDGKLTKDLPPIPFPDPQERYKDYKESQLIFSHIKFVDKENKKPVWIKSPEDLKTHVLLIKDLYSITLIDGESIERPIKSLDLDSLIEIVEGGLKFES